MPYAGVIDIDSSSCGSSIPGSQPRVERRQECLERVLRTDASGFSETCGSNGLRNLAEELSADLHRRSREGKPRLIHRVFRLPEDSCTADILSGESSHIRNCKGVFDGVVCENGWP